MRADEAPPKPGFWARILGNAVAEGPNLIEVVEHGLGMIANVEKNTETIVKTIHDLDAKLDDLATRITPVGDHIDGVTLSCNKLIEENRQLKAANKLIQESKQLEADNKLIEENNQLKADNKTLQEQVASHQATADVSKQQDKVEHIDQIVAAVVEQLTKVRHGVDSAVADKS